VSTRFRGIFYALLIFHSLAGASGSKDAGEASLLSETMASSIRDIAQGPSIEPSAEALQSHIAELQMDLRNTEFRLQFLYIHRTSLIETIINAKRQAEKSQG
jgi:hypothetical protein